jgi:hypothetical protein
MQNKLGFSMIASMAKLFALGIKYKYSYNWSSWLKTKEIYILVEKLSLGIILSTEM